MGGKREALGLLLGLAATAWSCQCVRPDEAFLYACESGGACPDPAHRCIEGLCRPPDAGTMNGADSGTDAGFDAGPDAGADGGLDAGGYDAGADAGADDAGADAGGDGGVADGGCQSDDEPDDGFLDSNCDGIDGEVGNAIFVDPLTGNDGYAGTRTSPKRTLRKALIAAAGGNKRDVYLSRGGYDEAALTWTQAVSIYGGYDADAGWARSDSYVVTLDGGAIGLTVLDVQAGVLDRVSVRSARPNLPGAASIAVLVIDAGVTFRHGTFAAGNGAPGAAGANGAAGSAGVPGEDGGLPGGSTAATGGAAGYNAACPNARGGAGGGSELDGFASPAGAAGGGAGAGGSAS